MGRIIYPIYEMENITCVKPPTRTRSWKQLGRHGDTVVAKSCTTLVETLRNNGIKHLSTGPRFLPSKMVF